MAESATLETIWEVDDALWSIVEPLLAEFWPRKRTGRPPACWRGCLNGIIHQLRTGGQWNRLPKQFGDDSTVHRWYQRWSAEGVLLRVWAVLVERCDAFKDVEWKWQAADGSLAKARFGGATSARIPRIARKTARRRIYSSRVAGAR